MSNFFPQQYVYKLFFFLKKEKYFYLLFYVNLQMLKMCENC